ncbi:MAG: glycosyltransferase, partial [Gammaproteobacteria bacterium]|nr:glycosyltransferase [Gammaproteobacteria bacterium]
MKIVFVLPTFNPGGAENVMVRLANHFQAQYDVHILVIKGGGILQENIRQSIPVHDLKCDRVRHAFGLLRGRIKSLEPDIVFSSISRLNILLSLIRLSLREKFRLILREVNTPSVALQATGSPGLYKFLYKLLYPRAEVIICQSDDMLGEMQTEIGLVKNKL